MYQWFNLSIILLVLGFITVLYSLFPKWVRPGLFFGVSITADWRHSDELKAIARSFQKRMILLGCVVSGIAVGLHFLLPVKYYVALLLSSLVLFWTFFLVFYFQSRKKVRLWSGNQPDKIPSQRAMDTSFRQTKGAISSWFYLFFLVPPMVTLWLSFGGVVTMPAELWLNFDLSLAPVNPLAVNTRNLSILPVSQVFLGAVFFFVHQVLIRARQELDRDDPQDSSRAQRKYRRRMSKLLFSMGLTLSSLFIAAQLTALQVLSVNYSLGFFLLAIALFFSSLLWAILTMGQGGSKLRRNAAQGDKSFRDDDRYWKGGMIYFNPKDPAIFVEKRFGFGWTSNFAHPVSWLLLLGILGGAIALSIWGVGSSL